MTQSTSPAWPDDHTFLGKSTDTGTSLVDVGARKYDPSTGRFISGDPVFQPNSPQTIGGYAYAGNDPVNGSDPTGLDPHTCAPGYHHDSSSGSMECVPDCSGGTTTTPGGDPTPHAQDLYRPCHGMCDTRDNSPLAGRRDRRPGTPIPGRRRGANRFPIGDWKVAHGQTLVEQLRPVPHPDACGSPAFPRTRCEPLGVARTGNRRPDRGGRRVRHDCVGGGDIGWCRPRARPLKGAPESRQSP
ncbi:RHS repeat-associated core domain-containing protein [Catenulispora sp. NF23]|nr:RHS repeat-associated core domain-containing protein [Catenulispora pinistramenti]